MGLSARLVDPRDITIEEWEPTFRVEFWSDDGAASREYDVDGAEGVDEVVVWADANVRRGETYVLGIRRPETSTPPAGGVPEVVFINLKGDRPGARRSSGRLAP